MDGVDAMDGMDGMWPATKNWTCLMRNMRIHRQKYRFQLSTIFQQQKVGLNRLNWTYQKKINDKTHTKASKKLTKHIHLYWGDPNTLRISFDLQHLVFLITQDIWENDPTNLQWIARMIPQYEVSPTNLRTSVHHNRNSSYQFINVSMFVWHIEFGTFFLTWLDS